MAAKPKATSKAPKASSPALSEAMKEAAETGEAEKVQAVRAEQGLFCFNIAPRPGRTNTFGQVGTLLGGIKCDACGYEVVYNDAVGATCLVCDEVKKA